MSKTAVQPVIMAGGSGTRLWPLSRAGYPKQPFETGREFAFRLAQVLPGKRTDIEAMTDRYYRARFAGPL